MEAIEAAARERAARAKAEKAAAEATAAVEASQPEAAAADAEAEAAKKAAEGAEDEGEEAVGVVGDEPWDSWVFMHSPEKEVTWKRTIARSPLATAFPEQLPPPTPGRWKSNALMSMSHAELDAHFATDWKLKLGLACHRTEVRARLSRSASSPSSVGSRKKPAVAVAAPLPTISAWKLWGEPGKVIVPYRECLSDHSRAPNLARKDPGGGPGEYSHKFMQREVWSPLMGEFQSAGGSRTKCGVNSLCQSSRWQYRDGIRRRMEGITSLDMYGPLKSNFRP